MFHVCTFSVRQRIITITIRARCTLERAYVKRNILIAGRFSSFDRSWWERVVNKVSSRHFPWRPSLIQTPYRSAATQDEEPRPDASGGKYFVFSKGEFFHYNYSPRQECFRFRSRNKFSTAARWHSIKGARSGKQASLLYTQTSFSFGRVLLFFFFPLRLFQRSSPRLLAFIKITDREAFVKKLDISFRAGKEGLHVRC